MIGVFRGHELPLCFVSIGALAQHPAAHLSPPPKWRMENGERRTEKAILQVGTKRRLDKQIVQPSFLCEAFLTFSS
jgi:hypothetical protein